jgi:hypothetical protein
MGNSPQVVSIHVLDDDSLVNIFYFCRPFFLGEDEMNLNHLQGGSLSWARGRWWYRPAHVCQRWRNLVLGSASYLHLSLVCTKGTPVANILAYSPPLPLTIDYGSKDDIAAEDEEGILLALEQRHRVRHLRLALPVQNLRKLVIAIDKEFPILEYLIVGPPVGDNHNITALMLPETLQTPNLHHLTLSCFTCPIRSRLHPTAVGLVTLYLQINHPSAYFQPNVLLQSISFMNQLESLAITFAFPVPNRDVKRQLTHTPITTHITLPNLRFFWLGCVNAYLEAVISRITTPRLENLQIQLSNELTFSVPRLSQFMNTAENLRSDSAVIKFMDKGLNVLMYFREANTCVFGVGVDCWHLDWQVSSAAQICNVLSQVFSVVEHLTVRHEVHGQSSDQHNDVARIEMRNLLRSFSNVKTLRVEDGLVNALSHCLRSEDEELPLELLPELQELTLIGRRDTSDAFTSFIDTRQNAGRPVTLVRHNPIPGIFEAFFRLIPAIASTSDEPRNDVDA